MDADGIIIGGGLVGGTMALAAAQAGLKVILLDNQPVHTLGSDKFDGRSYALALTTVRMLDRLGVWDDLAPNAQPLLDIHISDGRPGEGAGPFTLHFSHTEIEEGPMGHMVEDRHLRPALFAALKASEAEVIAGVDVTEQSVDGRAGTVVLSNGQRLSAPLLIGADGRHGASALRAGINREVKPYGQTALVAAIAHGADHLGRAHQLFLPTGPLAILPLKGNRSSIVWSEVTDASESIMALPDAEFLDHLRPRFGSFLGEISLAGKRWSYPLTRATTDALTAPRLALIGDSAHGVHPIAGQGLNAGMRDIAALAHTLAEARRTGQDLGSAGPLNAYSRWRGFDNAALSFATDRFNALFSNDNGWLRAARGLGLGLVNQSRSMRRAFIREAAGLSGNLPALMA